MTQAELAAIADVEQSNISAIENGRRAPSAVTLHRLLAACGYELLAVGGGRVLGVPPPVEDQWLEDLLAEPLERPFVTVDSPMEVRLQVLAGVLDVAEAVVQGR